MTTNSPDNIPTAASSMHQIQVDCDHDYYDHFWHPCCSDLALWQRVVLVAFHIITGFIPLLVGYVVSCCFNQASTPESGSPTNTKDMVSSVQKGLTQQPPQTLDSHKEPQGQPLPPDAGGAHELDKKEEHAHAAPIKGYSQVGQEAVEFARGKLKEHPNTLPLVFAINDHELDKPTNIEIAHLATLRQNAYTDLLIALGEEVEDWASEAVQAAATTFMKLSYAVSSLALEELSLAGVTLAELIASNPDTHLMASLPMCGRAYHICRAKIWIDKEDTSSAFKGTQLNDLEEFANRFYEDGTVQHNWNVLFNDYCDRVRMEIPEEQLASGSIKFLAGVVQKDSDASFRSRYTPVPLKPVPSKPSEAT